MSDSEDRTQPPAELSPAQLEVWHRVVAQYGTPTAHVAVYVSAVANSLSLLQETVDEAKTPAEKDVYEEELSIEQYAMERVLEVFTEHLWAVGAVPDRDTAAEVAEQLSQQFLAAWKTDHPGTPEKEGTPT